MSSDESAITLFESAARLALHKYRHVPGAHKVVGECLRQYRESAENRIPLILSPSHISQVTRTEHESIVNICEHLHVNHVVNAVARIICPNAGAGENDVAFETSRLEGLSPVSDEEADCPICGEHHAISDWLTEIVYWGIESGESLVPFASGRRGDNEPTARRPDEPHVAEEYSPVARAAVSVSGPVHSASLIGAAALLLANEAPSDGLNQVLERLDEKGAAYYDRLDSVGSRVSSTLVAPPPDGRFDPIVESKPTQIPGSILEEFCNAISTAYDSPSLKRLLRFKLGKHLDQLVSPGPYPNQCFDLISRAEREGWLPDLARSSCDCADNKNPLLAYFWSSNHQYF